MLAGDALEQFNLQFFSSASAPQLLGSLLAKVRCLLARLFGGGRDSAICAVQGA